MVRTIKLESQAYETKLKHKKREILNFRSENRKLISQVASKEAGLWSLTCELFHGSSTQKQHPRMSN